MKVSVKEVSGPSFEPVTLAEARLWMRVDDDDTTQDAVILMLVRAMRERAESITGRAFAQRTLEARLDAFPVGDIELPFASPLSSVISIQYVDSDGALQSMDSSPTGWQEDQLSLPGRISPLVSTSWPITLAEEIGAVRIRYVVGYAAPNAIPRSLRLWMQARAAALYENRESLIVGTIVAPLPRDFVDGLLDDLRIKTGFA